MRLRQDPVAFHAARVPKPKLADAKTIAKFRPLVNILNRLRNEGIVRPTRDKLTGRLGRQDYGLAGETKLGHYIKAANRADIVTLQPGVVGEKQWVELNEPYISMRSD